MDTLKHPACTLDWVARLCRSWLSPGKATEFPMGEIPLRQYSCKERKRVFLKKKNWHSNKESEVQPPQYYNLCVSCQLSTCLTICYVQCAEFVCVQSFSYQYGSSLYSVAVSLYRASFDSLSLSPPPIVYICFQIVSIQHIQVSLCSVFADFFP